MLDYIKKLELKKRFAATLSFSKAPNALYSLPQVCVTQIAGRLFGKERICHFDEIEQVTFLARELGLVGKIICQIK